jgi:SHS2 domain-containing protein
MVNWLRELLYLWSGKALLVASTQITQISDQQIEAIIRTEPFNPDRHRIRTEIKAVTYHQIRVDCRSTGWQARIIFDV